MDAIQTHRTEFAKRDLGLPFDSAKLLPEAYFPTNLRNPAKLQLHIWHDNNWVPTVFVRFDQGQR